MTQVYLQRIEISNFSAYGDKFSLSLPGPGVTILVGPDGLGKSTFFEAIEWALTGRVRRLEALTQESPERGRNNGLLARREEGVPVAQYGVSLEFVNGEGASTRIERRAVRDQENRERFVEVSSPPQQQLIELLREETLDAWQHEVDERRRSAELKRDRLLQLSAARTKIAQGLTQKASVTARIDRHTHEMWMIQPYLRDTTKTLQRIKDLDNRIGSLLLAKQELESCQQAYDHWIKQDEALRSRESEQLTDPAEQASHRARQEALQSSPLLAGVAWEQIPSHLSESLHRTQSELEAAQAAREELPDLEHLTDQQASTKERIQQLASTIKEEHEAVARIEEELLAAQALQQQYPELLAALGKLPSDEAHAIGEAVRAVEQLVHHERQLVQSEELRQITGVGDGAAYRWPVLLLDDPLQHHDLTHAEAFIEVLRKLVRDRKYQIILSVQDEALADSMRRKLEGVGIECVTCQ